MASGLDTGLDTHTEYLEGVLPRALLLRRASCRRRHADISREGCPGARQRSGVGAAPHTPMPG